ncbi:MAG: hypothetical protein HPKKFMNG_00510 [Planctomycetes bacterium]|nr:hypothetical protein [Planctomycetota bacterium]
MGPRLEKPETNPESESEPTQNPFLMPESWVIVVFPEPSLPALLHMSMSRSRLSTSMMLA